MLALQATSTGRLGGLGTRLDLSWFFRSILCSNVGAPVAQSVWLVFIRPRLESWLDLNVNFAFKTSRVVNSSIGRHSSVVKSRRSYLGSHISPVISRRSYLGSHISPVISWQSYLGSRISAVTAIRQLEQSLRAQFNSGLSPHVTKHASQSRLLAVLRTIP